MDWCGSSLIRSCPSSSPVIWVCWRWICCRRLSAPWCAAPWDWPAACRGWRAVFLYNRFDSMQTDYDILVAGGGIVGATLACALGTAGLKIGLIDDHPPPPIVDMPGRDYDLRVSAITLASRNVFQN